MSESASRLPCVATLLCLLMLWGSESAGQADTSSWLPYEMPDLKQLKGTALDMSFLLDAPAGRHGFLAVRGDKFFFEDGAEARFWGGNLFGEANFPSHKQAEALTERIAMTGANIIRMHHLDVVAPWTDFIVRKNLWGTQSPASTRAFDREMLDRFDYLVHCLKKRGIYIFLSHLSSRKIMPTDGLPDPADSLDDIYAGLKIEGEFDEFLIQLQQEHLKNLLTHKNPYTKLPLAGDPVLALTEIINEDSLLYLGMGAGFSANSDYYKRMLQDEFNEWLVAQYETREALAKAWQPKDGTGHGLEPQEDPAKKNVAFSYHCSGDPAARRNPAWSRRRNLDMYAFLYDTQGRYYDRMYKYLREIGVRCPIAGSNHWISDVADLHLNARLDYLDRHEYYAHPHGNYNYVQGQSISPATPMVKADSLGTIGGLAARRVYGLPYTVSEWHNCLPNPYRAEGPVFMAAYACLQDWHPMQYAYLAFIDYEPKIINSFMVFFDPAHMNVLPASALMFHRRDIEEAPTGYFERVSTGDLMDPAFSPRRNARIALLGKYGLAFDTAEGEPAPANTDLLEQASDATRRAYQSVTGQIHWDLRQGLLKIDSPRTQAVVGFTENQPIVLTDTIIAVENDFAVVVVSALDGESIQQAKRLLVSTSARAQWTGMEFDERRGVITKSGTPPFLMEPVTGKVTIRRDSPMRVYRLSSSGKRIGQVPAQRTDQAIIVDLQASNRCMHYELAQ
ncbi:MAG: hypothetical protein A2Y77_11430 [Planctomycetes bacterium RBG_13_62_9]|nr:MAG: hypothetical protein A2Y77_11430 [Planctomycetes bacterium RBG_13_62_9]